MKKYFLTPPGSSSVIITLTSYSARNHSLIKTLRCLIMQDAGYLQISVWLAPNDFLVMKENLEFFQKYRVKILRAPEDLRSYKKIYYSAQLWPDAILVTADDDIYYPRSWLRILLEEYNPNEKVIVGHRGAIISLNENGQIDKYENWEKPLRVEKARVDLLLTSGGGNLYPPHCFSELFFRKDIFMKICPSTDDLWQYSTLLLNGYRFKLASPESHDIHNWIGSQVDALWHSNLRQGGNDTQFANIRKMFPEIDQAILNSKKLEREAKN